jgi:tetratricopeptide (TPR) repeat protein
MRICHKGHVMATRSAGSKRAGKEPHRRPQQAAGSLHERWARLHATDREPWPDERLLGRLAKEHARFATWLQSVDALAALAHSLQHTWGKFHDGDFQGAIDDGSRLGPLGATIANKAAAVHSLYSKRGSPHELELLDAAVKRGEQAVALLPEYANAHYTLALALGRYSQGISILKALAAGIASRVRTHLERTLDLEPQHAEAHVAFGLYHAEIVAKLGALVASLTYGASGDAALEHLRRAAKLAPGSPIVHIEYANGLMLLDSQRHREEARALYAQAASFEPADEMERLDVERARRGLV